MKKRVALTVIATFLATIASSATFAVNGQEPESASTSAEKLLQLAFDHLNSLASAQCHGAGIRYELQKVWDLLVVFQIRFPEEPSSFPLSGDFRSMLDSARLAVGDCDDHIAQGLYAALREDFSPAVELLSRTEIHAGCGNAMDAEAFGRDEYLSGLGFLRGNFREALEFPLDSHGPDGILSVNIRSTRWALAYAMRACAYERLGEKVSATVYSCLAANEAKKPESSWDYYYRIDDRIWMEIMEGTRSLRSRVGGQCERE